MGFEIQRFQGDVDEEFICPICKAVLEDPLQAPECEHAFCRACITEWINEQPTCPVDRQHVTACQLIPVPRLMRNLLSRLGTSCDNAPHGCNAVLKLDSLASHLVECEFNPKRPMPCKAGCGLVIPRGELAEHNCVQELRALIATHQGKLNDYEQELAEHKRTHQGKLNDYEQELAEHKIMYQGKLNDYEQELAEHKITHQGKLKDYEQELAEHKRELALLKEFMRGMCLWNPSMRAQEREEVVRWANSLARASVASWDVMFSTPNDDLLKMIKESLSKSGCPPHIMDDLMENCRRRWWPPSRCDLETKQNYSRSDDGDARELQEVLKSLQHLYRVWADFMHLDENFRPYWSMTVNDCLRMKTLYEGYVFKKVPGMQAVLVLHCDNTHLGGGMVVEPGFILTFENGIE